MVEQGPQSGRVRKLRSRHFRAASTWSKVTRFDPNRVTASKIASQRFWGRRGHWIVKNEPLVEDRAGLPYRTKTMNSPQGTKGVVWEREKEKKSVTGFGNSNAGWASIKIEIISFDAESRIPAQLCRKCLWHPKYLVCLFSITEIFAKPRRLGGIHKWRQQRGGGRGLPKFWCSKGGCVILVLEIGSKCWQGGEGSKIPKFYLTSFVNGPLKKPWGHARTTYCLLNFFMTPFISSISPQPPLKLLLLSNPPSHLLQTSFVHRP